MMDEKPFRKEPTIESLTSASINKEIRYVYFWTFLNHIDIIGLDGFRHVKGLRPCS